SSGDLIGSFTAFSPFDTGGVYIAGGDLDGDGRAEMVVGAGAGTAPYVRTFDQHGQLLGQFRAYEEDFGGGVRVAVGDADHDGEAEIATAPGPGRRIDLKRFLPNGDLLWGFRVHDP